MDLSPQRVLKALPKSRERAVTVDRLADALGLNETQAARLREYLKEFARTGLAATKNHRYWRKSFEGLLIGTLRGTRSGHAFVMPEDERERQRGDLFIGERQMGAALHGDTVIARVIAQTARGREGRVEAVLRGVAPTVVGRFIRLPAESFVSPIDERFLYEVSVAPVDAMGARDGDMVNVEITRPPIAGRPPWGRVVEVLGQPDTPGIDIEIIVRKHRLPHDFSEA
ncbi:MAG TPA: hypothetical protein VIS78_07930, partial [Blastocatellia bacterium]